MSGCIDIYTSRRTEHNKCCYWKRLEETYDMEEYSHSNECDGVFYAKEISPQTLQKQIVGGMFMFDESTISLVTHDAVNIAQGDLVKYDDQYWNVLNVQKIRVKKQSQFLKNTSYKTYIQLKG